MEEYWNKIEEKLKEFWRSDDEIECIKVFQLVGQKCELCGYYPISWNHVLENSRTREQMTVGSECVHNFKKVINDLGKDIIIRYPLHLHKAGELINKRYPGTVEIEDASDYDKNEETMDDKAPEGMGMDDIDWESFDFECND